MRVEEDWLLTPCRMAIHLPTATGVLADLHLGYERARRRSGEAIPETGLEEVLSPLRPTLRSHGVRRLVIAGDLFEAGPRDDLAQALLRWLAAEAVVLTIVPGNHDRGISDNAELSPCLKPEGERLGRWLVVHGDQKRPRGPIVQGHEHPWFQWDARVGGPCYLVRHNHLVLPAFSHNASGGNVAGQARWARYRCGVVAGEEVLDFGTLGSIQRRSRLLTVRMSSTPTRSVSEG